MSRSDSPRTQRNRAHIAQAAARLIAEHGLNDWQAAKRKARRHLGLPDHEALPGNEEVEQALRDYNTLFQATAQTASLRAQRVDALGWMERLSQWKPLLTGAVAAGWATEHSEVRLELEAEDAKPVEPAALTCGLEHGVFPANLINGGWNPEGIFHAPDNVEIRKARLDHDHVGAFLQIQIYLPERLVRVRRVHLVAVLVAALEIAR